MVTYPQWTIPESIIKKEILPALKKDPGYLARKGFNLVDNKGETVDPYTVDWSKYKTGIPWKVVQGSGDDNALGIFKFNFNNPYSVYLHDTNQRYLFQNSERALSHGCVRVQKWQALAYYIARDDSIASADQGKTVSYNVDSIKTWIANKSRKRIMVKKRLPLFIEYFTCEAKNNKIVFYDDIYNEDRSLHKNILAESSHKQKCRFFSFDKFKKVFSIIPRWQKLFVNSDSDLHIFAAINGILLKSCIIEIINIFLNIYLCKLIMKKFFRFILLFVFAFFTILHAQKKKTSKETS